jgi:DNA polymerase/3'-5' exonuclease PolX
LFSGGSLKKESFANLHLMSATNETKAMDKMHEIKQQIPTKLSSLSNLSGKVSKKSVAGTYQILIFSKTIKNLKQFLFA